MNVTRGDHFLVFDDPDTRVRRTFSAVPIVLSSALAQDRTNFIEADVVVVDAQSRTGADIRIVCRVLLFEAGGVLDGSGAAAPSFPPGERRVAEPIDGADGPEGQDGKDGPRAALIDIWCGTVRGSLIIKAVGGAGGRGQDGGNGRQGAKGPTGPTVNHNRDFGNEPNISEYSGGRGDVGGKAGLPGRPGKGGSGGVVTLQTCAPVDNPILDLQQSPSGPPADPGAVGAAGEGGDPGVLNVSWCSGKNCPIHLEKRVDANLKSADLARVQDNYALATAWTASTSRRQALPNGGEVTLGRLTKRGNRGPEGLPGNAQTAMVEERRVSRPGDAGKSNIKQTTPAALASVWSEGTLELVCSRLEDEFRLGAAEATDFHDALAFYIQVARGADISKPVHPIAHERLMSIARKIQLGLDFYGFAPQQVPLLAMSTYRELLDRSVLPLAEAIELQFERYYDRLEQASEARALLKSAVRSAVAQVFQLKQRTEETRGKAQGLYDELPAIDATVAARLRELEVAKEKFETAFTSKGQCGFLETLKTASTIVAAVSGVGSAVLAGSQVWSHLVDDWNKNNESLGTLWKAREVLGKGLQDLSKQFTDASSGIAKIREGYAKLNAEERKLPAFSLARQQFDDIAREYADILKNESKEYAQKGHAYIDAVETRNKVILDYNALLVQLLDLRQMISAAELAVASAESSVNASYDPVAEQVVSRMRHLRRISLDAAASLVHAQAKAMAYHFASSTSVSLSARNFSEVASAHQAVLVSWSRAKERYLPVRRLVGGSFKLKLSEFCSAEAFAQFKQGAISPRPLALNVRIESASNSAVLARLSGLRLTGLRLRFVGAKAAVQGIVPWEMVHDGREYLLSSGSEKIWYSHLPVAIQGFTQFPDLNDVVDSDASEDGLYAGVSPYANWRLMVFDSPAASLDLSQLSEIEMLLDGYFVR